LHLVLRLRGGGSSPPSEEFVGPIPRGDASSALQGALTDGGADQKAKEKAAGRAIHIVSQIAPLQAANGGFSADQKAIEKLFWKLSGVITSQCNSTKELTTALETILSSPSLASVAAASRSEFAVSAFVLAVLAMRLSAASATWSMFAARTVAWLQASMPGGAKAVAALVAAAKEAVKALPA
jgi:hypothetical protein